MNGTQTAVTPDHIAMPDADPDVEIFLDDVEAFVLGKRTLSALFGFSDDEVQFLLDMAEEQLEAGRIDDALALYEGCVALNPEDVIAVCGYGIALLMKGRAARASEVLEAAVEMAPDDPAVREFVAAMKTGAEA